MELDVYFSRISKTIANGETDLKTITENEVSKYATACKKAFNVYGSNNIDSIFVNDYDIKLSDLKQFIENGKKEGKTLDEIIYTYATKNADIMDGDYVAHFRNTYFLMEFFDKIGKFKFNKCVEFVVDQEDLVELHKRCNNVLLAKSVKVSDELLPTIRCIENSDEEDYNKEYYNEVSNLLNTLNSMAEVIDNGDTLVVTFEY